MLKLFQFNKVKVKRKRPLRTNTRKCALLLLYNQSDRDSELDHPVLFVTSPSPFPGRKLSFVSTDRQTDSLPPRLPSSPEPKPSASRVFSTNFDLLICRTRRKNYFFFFIFFYTNTRFGRLITKCAKKRLLYGTV